METNGVGLARPHASVMARDDTAGAKRPAVMFNATVLERWKPKPAHVVASGSTTVAKAERRSPLLSISVRGIWRRRSAGSHCGAVVGDAFRTRPRRRPASNVVDVLTRTRSTSSTAATTTITGTPRWWKWLDSEALQRRHRHASPDRVRADSLFSLGRFRFNRRQPRLVVRVHSSR